MKPKLNASGALHLKQGLFWFVRGCAVTLLTYATAAASLAPVLFCIDIVRASQCMINPIATCSVVFSTLREWRVGKRQVKASLVMLSSEKALTSRDGCLSLP
jgi:hypothetical protein